jgi:hypothetical protein
MLQKEVIELAERIQRLRDDAEALQEHVRGVFGEEDTSTRRAGGICDALQRLSWDLERRYEQNIAASALLAC